MGSEIWKQAVEWGKYSNETPRLAMGFQKTSQGFPRIDGVCIQGFQITLF